MEILECPFCNYKNEEELGDLVNSSSNDGNEFTYCCFNCGEEFLVNLDITYTFEVSRLLV